MLFGPCRLVQVPFASGDDAHTNARALTHGTRLTEHSVRLSSSVNRTRASLAPLPHTPTRATGHRVPAAFHNQSIETPTGQRSAWYPRRDGDRGDGGDGGGARVPQTYKKRRARARVPPLDKAPAAIPRDADAVTRRGLTRTKASEREEGDGRRRPTRVFRRATGLFSPHGTCTTRDGPKPARSPS